MRKYLLSFFLLFSVALLGQPYTNSTCSTAMQIVSGQNYSYPAWTGNNPAQSGPAYNCLTSQPDPAWFFFMIGASGDIHIYMYTNPCKDIDFCLWGPFTTVDAGCNGGLTTSNVIDCSYSGVCSETADLTNCNPGDFYIMVITNFSTQATTVYFSQTSGTGVMSYFPAPTISNNGPICEGSDLTLTTNTVAGASYHWTGPNSFSSTLQNPVITSITAAQAGTYSCSLGAGSSFGPVSTTQVIVNPLPQPAYVLSSTICTGSQVSIGGTAQSGMTYTWTSNPPGFSSSLANPSVSPQSTTLYSLTVFQAGCAAHVVSTVNVLPLPIANAGNNGAVCEGSSTNIGATPVTGCTYSWSSSPAGFSSSSSNPLVTPASLTTYYLDVNGANGCNNKDTVIISILPKPLANTGPNQSICLGSAVTIGASAIIDNSYSWSSSPAGFISMISNPLVNPIVQTIYTLTETDVNNCSKSNSVTVVVNPKPAAFTGPGQSICSGDIITIGGSAIPGNTYAWSSSPAVFSSTLANPSVQPGITTVYSLTETNSNNCTKTNNVTIIVNPNPNPILQSNIPTCAGTPVNIGVSSTPGNTYSWSSNPAGFTSTLSNPNVNPSSNTTYTLWQTITATGCTKKATVVVTVNALPAAYTGPNQTICGGNSITIGGPNVVGSQFYWISNPSGFSSSISNPTVSPTVTTIYILTEIVVSTSCLKTKSVTVTVINKPKIEGIVSYDNAASTGLDSCRIDLVDLPSLLIDSVMTNNSGNYSIKCIDPGYYKVKPHCNKKWGGVNAADALMIAQYSVGMIPLSNLRKEAADVNQSHYVNALDAFLVMKRYAGLINSFPSGDWLLPTPDSSWINSLTNTLNITGVCYGDVNGSFNPPSAVFAPPPMKHKPEGKKSEQISGDKAIRNKQSMILPHDK